MLRLAEVLSQIIDNKVHKKVSTKNIDTTYKLVWIESANIFYIFTVKEKKYYKKSFVF